MFQPGVLGAGQTLFAEIPQALESPRVALLLSFHDTARVQELPVLLVSRGRSVVYYGKPLESCGLDRMHTFPSVTARTAPTHSSQLLTPSFSLIAGSHSMT
jgi:hypothetical protein